MVGTFDKKPPIVKETGLSIEFIVLGYMYEKTILKKENVYYSKIVQELKLLDYKQIDYSLDRLYDRCMIDVKKNVVDNGVLVSICFVIRDEIIPMAKNAYKILNGALKHSCDKDREKNE